MSNSTPKYQFVYYVLHALGQLVAYVNICDKNKNKRILFFLRVVNLLINQCPFLFSDVDLLEYSQRKQKRLHYFAWNQGCKVMVRDALIFVTQTRRQEKICSLSHQTSSHQLGFFFFERHISLANGLCFVFVV